jgi:hypothetical protein
MPKAPTAKGPKPAAPYPVGYGKPPKQHQFQPGKTGNPKGRQRGQPSLQQLILEEANKLVKVKAGEQVQHITKRQVLVRKLFQMALEGDLSAHRFLLAQLGAAEPASEADDTEAPLSAEELAVLKLLPATGGGPSDVGSE